MSEIKSKTNSAAGKPTADRGRLYAIHVALERTDTDKTLVIFCTSKMIIRQLCYSAAKKMSLGWPGPNGDIFKDIVSLLAKRHGQTTFVHIDLKAKNVLKQEAYSLAKSALEVPCSVTSFEPTADRVAACAKAHPTAVPDKRKVVTAL